MSKGKRILIVDDEPDLREILADEFRFEGFEVFEAPNGVVGLEMFSKESPDVVVSDIRMPGGDGVTFARAAKAIKPTEVPIFLITGFADLTPEEAYDFGVDGFFVKPFQLDTIKSSVMRAMQDATQKLSAQVEIATPASEVAIPGDDWKKSMDAGTFKVGRGGLSALLESFSPMARPLRFQEVVNVKCAGKELFTGIVRWVRTNSKELPPAVGIEFLSATPEFLSFYNAKPELQKLACFIPSQK